MKAVILCAGYGTRLRPLTENTPKPLVKIMGVPILEYTLNLLANSGIKDFYINRHHLPDSFKGLSLPKDVNVDFSLEKEILGTAGGIISFEDRLNEDFLVVNGDILFNLDVDHLISFHKRSKKIATMVLKAKDKPSTTSVFKDDFSNVVKIGGDKTDIYKEFMFSGIHVLSPEFFNLVKRTTPPSCVVKDFYKPYISSGGKVGAYIMEENKGAFWKEIGDLKSYLDCNIWALRSLNELSFKGFYELFLGEYWEAQKYGNRITEVVEGIWLGDGVVIDPSTTLIPPVFIGPRSKLGANSVVGPNVVCCSGVTVEEGAIVNESVILDNTAIRSSSRTSRMVIDTRFEYTDQ